MMERLRPFADLLLGLALVATVDLFAFHLGFYFSWLRPDSYSGRIEETSRRFAELRAASPLRQVVVMSNSTGGSCVAEQLVENQLQEDGWPLAVANLSEGGSTARSWYHLLRHEKVDRATTAVVILGVHPHGLVQGEDKPDLQIVKTRLALADAAILPWSYEVREKQLQVLSQVFFRTPLFREDLHDFLAAPAARLAAVAKARQEEQRFRQGWRRAIAGRLNLTTVRLDEAGNLDLESLPPRLREDAGLVRQLGNVLRRKAELAGAPGTPMAIEPKQAHMLRATIEMLNERDIPVVVAVTPESPFPLTDNRIEVLEQLVSQLRAEGRQVLLYHDVPMLKALENPVYFRDLLHLNVEGAGIYSRGLATFLATAFAGSELKIEERRGIGRRQQDGRPDQSGDQQAADG